MSAYQINSQYSNINSILYFKFFLTLFCCYSLAFDNYKVLTTLMIVINGLLLYESRNQKAIFLVFSFFFMYSLILFPYYFKNVDIAVFKDYNDSVSFGRVLKIHCLFLTCIYLFYKPQGKGLYIEKQIKQYENNYVYYFNLTVILFLVFFSKSGENIFESGGYGRGEVKAVGGLAIYEYAPLFFLVGFVFSGKSKFKIRLLLSLIVLYVLRTLLFGGRIEVVQTLFLVFILFLEKKAPLKVILIILFLGYVFNEITSVIRGNPTLLLNGDFSFIWDIFKYKDTGRIANNQGDVWHASSRVIGLVHDGIISTGDRLYSFCNWVLSLFMPSRFVDKIANLPAYMTDVYPAGGGGLISAYFYAWLSYFGIVSIAFYIASLLNKVYTTKNQYLLLYTIMVLITSPRWFAYNPIVMFKLCAYIIPICFLYKNLKIEIKNDT